MGPNSRNAKSLFEQIQNLYLLYKGKPRFGPESCDECLNFMSHLRPIGHYFEMFDDPSKRLENFGPEVQHGGTMGTNDIITSESWPISGGHAGNKSHHLIDDDDATDRAENELSNYSSKLISYLNEQPIENDQMLIYSTGEFIVNVLVFYRYHQAISRPKTPISYCESKLTFIQTIFFSHKNWAWPSRNQSMEPIWLVSGG